MIKLNIIRSNDPSALTPSCENAGKKQREEIRMDQIPKEREWSLIALYKLTSNGSMLYWQVGFDGVNNLEISHGYSDGVIRTDRTEIKTNTTGRDINEQALLEARQRYRLKYREGYQPAGSTTAPLTKGMKGYEYKENSIKKWPVYTQPKLNGIRMLCRNNVNRNLSMYSWLNNPFNNLDHLEEELNDFFEYLPKNSILDGELYNHNMDFTILTSAVKTIKHKHDKLKDVQYWIFDINYEDHMGTPYEKRYELLVNSFHRYIQDNKMPKNFTIVNAQLAQNHSEIMIQHDQHVAMGYEGIMIKKISNGMDASSKIYNESLYKSGKCNHILKYKQFIDEEALIISVTEAEGTEKGAAIFNVQDKRGNIFPVRLRGDFETRRFWWKNQQLVIGKEITIRYQELSIYGIPRFPVGVSIRDYE